MIFLFILFYEVFYEVGNEYNFWFLIFNKIFSFCGLFKKKKKVFFKEMKEICVVVIIDLVFYFCIIVFLILYFYWFVVIRRYRSVGFIELLFRNLIEFIIWIIMVGFNVIFNVFGVFMRLKVYVICVFNLFFCVIYNVEYSFL